jgi:MFS family permease
MAMFGVGAILGGFIGGKLSDKIGFYPVQFWSLFLNGIMFIVLGQLHELWQIAVCIFILSTVGESFRPANASAIAFYSNENNRTRSYSLSRLAINLGFSIGPAVGGFLSSISYQWLFSVMFASTCRWKNKRTACRNEKNKKRFCLPRWIVFAIHVLCFSCSILFPHVVQSCAGLL